MSIFVGDVGLEIRYDVGEDISSATTTDFKYKKPSGGCESLTGALDGTQVITYTTEAGDLDEGGVYDVQPYIVLPSWTGHATSDTFTVLNLICST